MSLKKGMGWAKPLNKKTPSLEKSVEQAAAHFKATRGRWPNFIRVPPGVAEELKSRLDGLLVIPDPYIGKSYLFLMGYSKEA